MFCYKEQFVYAKMTLTYSFSLFSGAQVIEGRSLQAYQFLLKHEVYQATKSGFQEDYIFCCHLLVL
jgi:hypothetical protein